MCIRDRYCEGSYDVKEVDAYDFNPHPPFYALGSEHRVAIFDVPQTTLSEDVNGKQVLAWGAHSPQTPSHSLPNGLLNEINQEFGEHPALHKDHGDWWNKDYLHFLHDATLTGIKRRTQIILDWIKKDEWDLLLTIYGETHSAGHDFWHLSDPSSPLHEFEKEAGFDCDPLLEVFQGVDKAVGDIAAAAPADAHIVVFSVHGSGNNVTDVPSMLLLPELMYRYSFPGYTQMAPGVAGTPVSSQLKPKGGNWQWHSYTKRHENIAWTRWVRSILPGRIYNKIAHYLPRHPLDIRSIIETRNAGDAPEWQPCMWYKHLWPQMKAFAIPSFSEGYIRLNLEGREPEGIVASEDYDAVCDELEKMMLELVNPRTGRPLVKKVVKTRAQDASLDASSAGADLVVVWSDDEPADTVDHPELGRIGPVPYRRSGSHRARGFWAAKGPKITAGCNLPDGHAIDLAPTLLELMGASPKTQMDGNSLLDAFTKAG